MAQIRTPAADLPRALLVGSILGALLTASNVYTGLKTSYIDGGAITASILTYGWLSLRRRTGDGLGATINVAQVTAATAASMVAVVGLAGPVPALSIAGHSFPPWVWVAWGCALGWLGIWVGTALRHVLIDTAGLPFPTGRATAGVIDAMARREGSGLQRAGLLFAFAVPAIAITWGRDAAGWIPQDFALPGMIAGVPLAALTIGLNASPTVAATGALMGIRAALSMTIGSLLSWAWLVPTLAAAEIIPDLEYGTAVSWLMWPAVTLLTSGVLTSFVIEWSSNRGMEDLSALVNHLKAGGASRWLPVGIVAMVVGIGVGPLGLPPGLVIAALVLAVVLATISARAVGETDIAPVGPIGAMTQMVLGSSGVARSLSAGLVTAGVTASTAQSLWAYKATEILGVARRPVVIAQIVGVVVGAVVSVPVYGVVTQAYGLGTSNLPAWGALAWHVTAEAAQGRLWSPPAYCGGAMLVAAACGVGLALWHAKRPVTWLPSPVALGIGLVWPASYSGTMLVGALSMLLVLRWRPNASVGTAAAGAIAGESLAAVTHAIWTTFG